MKNIKNKNITEQIAIVAWALESIAGKTVLEPLNMTMTGYKILHILHERGSVPISGVIDCLGSTKSNVSQRLDFLEKNGFVERVAAASGDKRQVMIVLTEKGREKFSQAKDLLLEKSVKLEEIFTEQELEVMRSFLNKMFERLVTSHS